MPAGRAYDRSSHQPMGLLPTTRTTPNPPFHITGVDFAGPFVTRRGHTRKPTMVKAYVCLFICFTTKAIHIELCLDLSTEEFLAAFRRFCARRGVPQEVHSDNGTNFVGNHFAANNITWKFNPPRAPHMGGLWEAAVKAMKRLMRKSLQAHLLKVDELTSILVEIEAILNSRPLVPLETTDLDNIVLTPGHFLIGRPFVSPPTKSTTSASISSLKRWQLTQKITQDLWKSWKTTYLQSI